jgi:hypothetical protein
MKGISDAGRATTAGAGHFSYEMPLSCEWSQTRLRVILTCYHAGTAPSPSRTQGDTASRGVCNRIDSRKLVSVVRR